MNKDYILQGKTPEFTAAYEKLKDHWDEFVEYKTSEEAKKRSAINKKNAAKKEYHHSMGSGGYRATKPKLEKDENDLLEKGIIPETLNGQSFGSTGMEVSCTQKQGSAFLQKHNLQPPSLNFKR